MIEKAQFWKEKQGLRLEGIQEGRIKYFEWKAEFTLA